MTSSEIDLQEEKLKKTGCFNFTWSIQNFSHCALEINGDGYIESPIFAVISIDDSKWNLELHPKGYQTPGFISCYLRRRGNNSESCASTLSIRKCNGTFEKRCEQIFTSRTGVEGEGELISHLELNEPGAYLENDTLNIGCRIWKDQGADSAESGTYCYAQTEVRVSKLDYVWNLGKIVIPNTSEYKFNHSAEIKTFISCAPTVKMQVLNKANMGEDVIHFGIKVPQQEKDVFLIMKVHMLDKDGKIIHSVCAEHLFQLANKKLIWDFPIISKRILYLNKKIYMPSGELILKCEFSFSGYPEFSSVSYGCDIQKLKRVTPHPSTDGYEIWKENLQTFFKDGKLSDVVVRTSSHEFPAHRAILCAQSDVFLAMFENDMKEKETGIIEIEDLEDDTVNKMLSCLYTNAIEELDSSAAQKLYYAADRYGIKSLLRICSNHLMRNLDASNVCEILVLADTHQDEELKSYAKNFILVHAQEVIDSENWKSLMETSLPLTSEIMHWILCCKFSKVK